MYKFIFLFATIFISRSCFFCKSTKNSDLDTVKHTKYISPYFIVLDTFVKNNIIVGINHTGDSIFVRSWNKSLPKTQTLPTSPIRIIQRHCKGLYNFSHGAKAHEFFFAKNNLLLFVANNDDEFRNIATIFYCRADGFWGICKFDDGSVHAVSKTWKFIVDEKENNLIAIVDDFAKRDSLETYAYVYTFDDGSMKLIKRFSTHRLLAPNEESYQFIFSLYKKQIH